MKTCDFRSLPPAAQEDLRRKVVKSVLDATPRCRAAPLFGAPRQSICNMSGLQTFIKKKMRKRIAILGKGKLACALVHVFGKHEYIVRQFGRDDFEALHPETVASPLAGFLPDIICNCVVFGGIDQCALDSIGAWQVNTLFPKYLAQEADASHASLVHFSTEAVFPDTPLGALTDETAIPAPSNIYGLTKYGADCLIPAHTSRFHIFRLPLLFGPSLKRNQFLEKLLLLGIQRGSLHISRDIYSNAA